MSNYFTIDFAWGFYFGVNIIIIIALVCIWIKDYKI